MLYNILKLKVNNEIECFSCPFHDNKTNRCNGYGKCCYPMEELTGVVVDILTNKALTDSAIENIHNNLVKETE